MKRCASVFLGAGGARLILDFDPSKRDKNIWNIRRPISHFFKKKGVGEIIFARTRVAQCTPRVALYTLLPGVSLPTFLTQGVCYAPWVAPGLRQGVLFFGFLVQFGW